LALVFAVVPAFGEEPDDTLPPPPPNAAPAPPPTPPTGGTAPATAPAAEEAKKAQVEVVGPLEVQAAKATVRVSRINTSTCLAANRLRIKTRAALTKVALLIPDFRRYRRSGRRCSRPTRASSRKVAPRFVTAPRGAGGWSSPAKTRAT
jgi:hypothetical protein